MKNLFFAFFLFPIFSFGQYGFKQCHTDMVVGFDIGDRMIYSNTPKNQNLLQTAKNETSPIYTYRFGMNINYPISGDVYLVPGFRMIAKQTSTLQIIQGDFPTLEDAFSDRHTTDFYAEIPFAARYVFKRFNKENRIYLEGGLQMQAYVATYTKNESGFFSEGAVTNTDKFLERDDDYAHLALSASVAVGFESELNPNLTFFVMPVFRHQFTKLEKRSPIRFYHIGLETGFRF